MNTVSRTNLCRQCAGLLIVLFDGSLLHAAGQRSSVKGVHCKTPRCFFSSFFNEMSYMPLCVVRPSVHPSVCPSVIICANRFFSQANGWIATKLTPSLTSPSLSPFPFLPHPNPHMAVSLRCEFRHYSSHREAVCQSVCYTVQSHVLSLRAHCTHSMKHHYTLFPHSVSGSKIQCLNVRLSYTPSLTVYVTVTPLSSVYYRIHERSKCIPVGYTVVLLT